MSCKAPIFKEKNIYRLAKANGFSDSDLDKFMETMMMQLKILAVTIAQRQLDVWRCAKTLLQIAIGDWVADHEVINGSTNRHDDPRR